MLFKILHGDASRISTDITPFHEGYCYVTHDGFMYIDMNIGTEEAPNNQRIKLNAQNAEALMKTLDEQYIPDTIARTSELPTIVVSDTVPTDAKVGAIWIDTSVTSIASAEGVEF